MPKPSDSNRIFQRVVVDAIWLTNLWEGIHVCLSFCFSSGEPLPKGEKILHHVPHLEESGPEVVKALPQPRIIKTHLPRNMVPWNDKTK